MSTRKKVGFIQFASSPVHFAGLLELAHDSYNEGNSVYFAIWGAQTHFPCRMSTNFQTLSKTIPRKIVSVLRIAAPESVIENTAIFDRQWVSDMMAEMNQWLSSLKNIDDFSLLKIGEINPGPAIANEYVSITQSRNTSPAENIPIIRDLLRSYFEVFSATQIWITRNSIDKLFLFNGRFLHERAAWDAGRQIGVDIDIFETTRNNLHVRAEGFHNRRHNQKMMLEHWKVSTDSNQEKIKLSDLWFANLRGESNPFSTNSSRKIKIDAPFILYFSNSDDEAIGFWEHWSQNLGTQIDCVKKLIKYFEARHEYTLIIRLHPNLASKPKLDQKEWINLASSKNVKIIGPTEKVSSYALIQECQGVITFGSTIGIEAAYMEKPVMILADCKYDELGFAYKPNDWSTAFNWIENLRLVSVADLKKNRELSRIFGYFVLSGGNRFKYSNLEEVGWGSWKVNNFLGFNWVEPVLLSFYRRAILKMRTWRMTRKVKR